MSEGHRNLSFLDQNKMQIVDPCVDCISPQTPTLYQQNTDLGWIYKIVNCGSGVDPHQSPFSQPPINKIQIWDGLTKLLIVNSLCLSSIALSPASPCINKMRIWGGLTKLLIVDPLCRSSITFPPPHTIDTKTALAKWSRFLAQCPTLYSLIYWYNIEK